MELRVDGMELRVDGMELRVDGMELRVDGIEWIDGSGRVNIKLQYVAYEITWKLIHLLLWSGEQLPHGHGLCVVCYSNKVSFASVKY